MFSVSYVLHIDNVEARLQPLDKLATVCFIRVVAAGADFETSEGHRENRQRDQHQHQKNRQISKSRVINSGEGLARASQGDPKGREGD